MSPDVNARRLFFALWPSDDLREQVARGVAPALEGRRARPVPSANFHITIAFLGSIAAGKLPAVIDAADQVDGEPFELTLDRLESWRAAHAVCMTISMIPPALAAVVERLRFSLLARRVAADQKPFRAHLTVARDWREGGLDQPVGPYRWPVTEFVLVESTLRPGGSQYHVVRAWPLAQKRR